ncbi:MAG: beta-carotene hydroxylase [Candidatus Lokiarchaeota archaeon]|nr:beta-carotene hydroxylase [Candidatus Lokiarchaeota archaeon]
MLNPIDYLPFPYVIFASVAIILFFAVFMEGFAWFLHRYVMHHIGWYLHEDHHRYTKGRFQKNDIFALFFSLISFFFILFGLILYDILFWVGIGVAIYGMGYFIFHDILFHKRLKNNYRPKSEYMKRIFIAHSFHHQTTNRKGSDGYAYGFLYSSKKYIRMANELKNKRNKLQKNPKI